jgi:hypothetical protein
MNSASFLKNNGKELTSNTVLAISSDLALNNLLCWHMRFKYIGVIKAKPAPCSTSHKPLTACSKR